MLNNGQSRKINQNPWATCVHRYKGTIEHWKKLITNKSPQNCHSTSPRRQQLYANYIFHNEMTFLQLKCVHIGLHSCECATKITITCHRARSHTPINKNNWVRRNSSACFCCCHTIVDVCTVWTMCNTASVALLLCIFLQWADFLIGRNSNSCGSERIK